MNFTVKLRNIAKNLWWTWQPDAISLFRDIDPSLWRQVNHNPVAFLSEISPKKIEQRALELASESRISYIFHRLQEYLEQDKSWTGIALSPLRANPVAYFSAEFGLHESIPIYSGGLGILAGDHLKSASDLGVPLIGIGLLYAQGYFNQYLNKTGWQEESYFETRIEHLPLECVLDIHGNPHILYVETNSNKIAFRMWLTHVGRARLLLLDSDVKENSPYDRELVARLYGGDANTRIRQELLLGIGGARALETLGIRPSVLHLNEGHSSFAIFEMTRQEMVNDEISFNEALCRVGQRTVFTTHTPVEAGHDRFDSALMEQVLGPVRNALRLSPHEFMALGRINPDNENEPFCMTVLGLKVAQRSNGVSALHGKVTRRMWHALWKDRTEDTIPIGHITNGVHVATWISPPMRQLYDRCLGPDWESRMSLPETWTPINSINDAELWEAIQISKARMANYVQRQVCAQEARREGKSSLCDMTKKRLDPEILTVGFARRFATYKRADLLLYDDKKLEQLILDAKHPVQIIFAGKAHPKDDPAKKLIQRIFHMSKDERFLGRIVFIEDYDMNVARHLLQGIDLWLNIPLRPLEASGSSGMKAVFNGTLNCSILDGWWAEAYNGYNGFAVGIGGQHSNHAIQDRRDAEDLYRVFEQEIIPLYYRRDTLGIPRGWITRIKNALLSLAWRFNADRMVMEYARKCYLPCVGAGHFPQENHIPRF
ncbi:MAG: alpha-glucan family phosphorylase [Candidatus Brocadiaceae bacterium]|nr:alpha-glucan family phosphorylase [Candidatus Brocadiaceae bacterium]